MAAERLFKDEATEGKGEREDDLRTQRNGQDITVDGWRTQCQSDEYISKIQDDEVGDGTTPVVVLAGELLREAENDNNFTSVIDLKFLLNFYVGL
nr:T-complex protein 1 subunit beta [Tanacetum cinerariifolium]